MNIEEIKIAILDELKRGPALAADITNVLGLSIGGTGKALRQLRKDGDITIENGAYMLPDENEGKRAGKSKPKVEPVKEPPADVDDNVATPKTASKANQSSVAPDFMALAGRHFDADVAPFVGVDMADSSKQSDPLGIDQHAPGAKLDAGKPLAGVLLDFGLALESVSRIGTFGAVKYTRGGWQSVPGGEQRYEDAAMRHLLRMRTERIDSETGMPHLWAAAWNMLAVIELQERGNNDTRNHS
jgi:hypothetical protein